MSARRPSPVGGQHAASRLVTSSRFDFTLILIRFAIACTVGGSLVSTAAFSGGARR